MNAKFAEQPLRYHALFTCTFCLHQFRAELPVGKDPWPTPYCERCLVLSPARGVQVRYDAWHHRGPHPGHQSPLLRDGAIYTIDRVLQRQHNCLVTLQETKASGMTFSVLLFTPATFAHVPGTPSWTAKLRLGD